MRGLQVVGRGVDDLAGEAVLAQPLLDHAAGLPAMHPQVAQAQEARQRPRGANERVRLGVIGIGNRGGQLMDAAMKHKDAQIIALCDVYEPYLDKWKAKIGGGVQTYKDFRQLLENKDVDAVVVATPDHWHAIQFIQACEAGKDVYAEKPLSLTVVEGRRMVEAGGFEPP